MSYLRGPLTRQQIRILMDPQRKALGLTAGAPASQPAPAPAAYTPPAPAAPLVTPGPVASPAGAPVTAPPVTTPPAQPTQAPAVSEPPKPKGATPPPPGLPEMPTTAKPATAAPPSVPLPEFSPSPTISLPTAPPELDTPAAPPEPAFPATPVPSPSVEVSPAPAYSEPSYPVNPAPLEGSTASPGYTQPPVINRATNATSLTQRGPALPDDYHDKPPALPSSTAQFFLPTLITTQQAIRDWEKRLGYEASSFGGAQLLYRPVLLSQLTVRYLDRKTGVEEDQRWAFQVPNLDKAGLVRWGENQSTPIDPNQVSGEPFGEAFYGSLPSGLTDTKRMTALKTEVVDYVYRSATLTVFYNSTLDVYGSPRDNRRDYLIKLQQKAREARDAEIDKTTQQYDKDLDKLDERLRKELRGLTYDKQVLDQLKREDLYTTGEAVLSLLKGRTTYTLSRMSRARRYKTQAQERAVSTEHAVADLEDQIDQKRQDLQRVLQGVNDKWAKIATSVEEVKLTPYKKDITLEIFGIGWVPAWYTVLNGQSVMLPAFSNKQQQ